MVEAPIPHKLLPTSISYIFKAFSNLICCGWAFGLWGLIHLCRWVRIFGKLGAWLSLCDVVRSLLMLLSPANCIPHSYYIYTECVSTLICCGWAHGCTVTVLRKCGWVCIFGKLGAWLSLSDAVRSWLRLQRPVDHIPLPYHTYRKCFSTLICCVWAYGCTLSKLFHQCG